MKPVFYIVLFFFAAPALLSTTAFAQDSLGVKDNHQQNEHGNRFVDLDGDGFNDNAPDHDGDGIPNGLDPDYEGRGKKQGKDHQKFLDLDGDAFNDNRGLKNSRGKDNGNRQRMGKSEGPQRSPNAGDNGNDKGNMGNKKNKNKGRNN